MKTDLKRISKWNEEVVVKNVPVKDRGYGLYHLMIIEDYMRELVDPQEEEVEFDLILKLYEDVGTMDLLEKRKAERNEE